MQAPTLVATAAPENRPKVRRVANEAMARRMATGSVLLRCLSQAVEMVGLRRCGLVLCRANEGGRESS